MTNLQQRIAVLMGGCSSEREISLRSGQAVLSALQSRGLDVVAVDLAKDSHAWYGQIEASKASVAFIALHGTYGEDGCVQGLLETMKIPYTGSGVLASSICMNKKLTKSLLQHEGVVTPQSAVVIDGTPRNFPVFVKPIAEGSSVGLHYVKDKTSWLDLNLDKLESWLVEDCVSGVEVAVSVLNGQALPVVEISPKSGMYDFESKYTKGATDYYCPARLTESQTQQCMNIAMQAVKILGCEGAPRVDLIVPTSGSPVVLEVNTIPGMTETSLLPKSASQAGMDFQALCVELINSAKLGSAS